MDIEERKMYSEVYGVIMLLGKKYIDKLPKGFIRFIRENKLDDYEPYYTLEKNLVNQGIKKSSLAFLTIINYKYWAETEKDREEIFSVIGK